MKRESIILLRDSRPLLIAVALACAFFLSPSNVGAQQDGNVKTAALLKKVDTLLEEGNAAKAIETLRKSAAEDPGNPVLYDRLGYTLLQEGRPDDAIADFNSALRIRPDFKDAKTGIGLSLLKKGDLKAAESELAAALTLNPNPSMTHYALGLLYEKENDYEKAIAQFKEGIRTFKGSLK
jgi:tetratricopeptide (TPR) repeat protein